MTQKVSNNMWTHSGAFKDSSLLGYWHFVTGWVVSDVLSYHSVFYLQVQSVQEGLFDCLLQNGRNFLPSDTASQLRRPTSSHIDADIIFASFCSKVFIFTFPEIFLLVTEPDNPLHSASCCLQVQFIPYILLSTRNARSTCNRHNHFWEISWVWCELNVKHGLLQ